MKKILVILLCAVIAFSCSGCGLLIDAIRGEDIFDRDDNVLLEREDKGIFDFGGLGDFLKDKVGEADESDAVEAKPDDLIIVDIGCAFVDAFARNEGAEAAEYVAPYSDIYDVLYSISPESRVKSIVESVGVTELTEMLEENYLEQLKLAEVVSAEGYLEGETATVVCEFKMPEFSANEINTILISNTDFVGIVTLEKTSDGWLVVDFEYDYPEYYYGEEVEDQESAATEAVPEVEEEIANGSFYPGYLEPTYYESDYLGLAVELDSGWTFFSREDVNYLSDYPEGFLVNGNTAGIENYVAFTEAFAYRQVGDTYEEFIITMEKESDYTSGLPLEERIAISMGAIEEGYAAAYEDYYWEEISIECGSREFPGVYVELFDGQNYTYKLMFLLDCGEYTATFEITKFTSNFVSELAMIYELA